MTPTPLRPMFLALTFALLPVAGALAATNLYLDIPDIPGASTDPAHRGQIVLQEFTWTASVGIIQSPSGLRFPTKPAISDIRWTQGNDVASAAPLMNLSTSGTPVAEARFRIDDGALGSDAPSVVLTARSAPVVSLNYSGSVGNPIRLQGSMNTADLALGYVPGASSNQDDNRTTDYNAATDTVSGSLVRKPELGPGSTPTRAGLYLRLTDSSGAIAGDQATIGYENWIAIDSYAMSASKPSGPGGSNAGKPVFDEFSWTQRLDATAPVVLRNLLGGEQLAHATLEQVVIGSNGLPVTVLQQAMNNVFFTNFTLSAREGEGSRVEGSLSFGSYSQTVWVPMPDGRRLGPFSVGYDVEGGRSMRGALAAAAAGFGTGNLDGTAAPIPEPQTWALLLAGLAGVLVRARRHRALA